MTKFIFKINQKRVEFETLPNGPPKDKFESMKSTIAGQLQSLKCKTHNHEPMVMLGSDDEEVSLQGFGTCCQEFDSTVRALINVPADWKVVTRVMHSIYEQ